MAEFIGRWFTASNSDQSGMVGNKNNRPTFWGKVTKSPAPRVKKKGPRSRTRFAGGADSLGLPKQEARAARKTLLGQ